MENDARLELLGRLIDDAGLFPPASLSMAEATRAHSEQRNGPLAWMLGRFLCPASRLEELARSVPEPDEAGPWRLSAILDGASADHARLPEDLALSARFAKEAEGRVVVELVELRLRPDEATSAVDAVVDAIAEAGLPGSITPFLEIPHDAALDPTLDAIADARSRCGTDDPCAPPGAKLRCGGADEDATPSPIRVASFIAGCRERGIPFKATAGLHHPFRHRDPATGRLQHGFVNLAGASVLALDDLASAQELEPVIADEDPGAFGIEPDGFRWHDHHAEQDAVETARRDLFVAYGSCSFTEPTDDLRDLGLLPT